MAARFNRIKIDNLFLDSDSPRLPSHLRGASEPDIIKYLLQEASTLDLMEAIGENGFFEGEQLLVFEAADGRFKVVEGNRRLTAVILLRDPTRAPVQQLKVQRIFDEAEHKGTGFCQELPCAVFDDEKVIHRYLGYRHITGVQPWNLTQRAEYLSSLRKDLFPKLNLDLACRELAKMIGSRRDYVKRIVVGYRVYEEIEKRSFFKIKGLSEDSFYFNYIADSLNKSAIAEFLGIAPDLDDPLGGLNVNNLKLWTQWFFEKYGENQTRLKGRSDDLAKLNAILSSDIAKHAFVENAASLNVAFEQTAD